MIQLKFEPVKNQFVTALAVMEPVGHAGDGGGGDFKLFGDSGVGALLEIESCGDLETFGEFANFGEGEEITEKAGGFVWVFEFQNGSIKFFGHNDSISRFKEGGVG